MIHALALAVLITLGGCAGWRASQGEARGAHEAAFSQALAAWEAKDYPQAFAMWESLARAGDVAAQRNAGHMLRRGLGVARDPMRALGFYLIAARAGHTPSQINAATMLWHGESGRKDRSEARHWLARAQAAGDAHALVVWASLTGSQSGKIAPTANERH